MERPSEPRTARAARRVPGDPARMFDVATLRQFVGAGPAITLLEDAADRAVQTGRVLEDTLILGPVSSGKSVVARALARDAAQRAIEIDAAWARSSRQVARALRAIEERDALILRRIDELRPGPLRMLVSMMAARSMPRELVAGPALADCTVIATAERMPRRGGGVAGQFALCVALPEPGIDASIAAAFRAAQALGMPASAEARKAVELRVEAATVGAWSHPTGRPSPSGEDGWSASGGRRNAINLAAIARMVASSG